MNLGLAIEECRKLKGVTKSALAAKAELSSPYLTQIIRGQREPSISIIEKIACALGIPSSLLIFLASDDSEVSSITEETKRELRNLSKHLIQESSETSSEAQVFR